MSVLGIIPARKGSQRFPNKHHVPLLGKPLFAYTIEAAMRARRLDRLVISSDDPQVAAMAGQYGVEFIARPSELADDVSPLDDALRHACDLLAARDGFHPNIVVAMQGNVPVRKEGQIDEVIERLERLPKATAVCTAQPQRCFPEVLKVIVDDETARCAPYMCSSGGYRTQDYPAIYMVDGAVCAVRTETLWAAAGNRAIHAWLGPELHLVVQEDARYSIEVDYPSDAALAECYLRLHSEQTVPRA